MFFALLVVVLLRAAASLAQDCIAADTGADIISIVRNQQGHALICITRCAYVCSSRHLVTQRRFCILIINNASASNSWLYMCTNGGEQVREEAFAFAVMDARTHRPASMIPLFCRAAQNSSATTGVRVIIVGSSLHFGDQ